MCITSYPYLGSLNSIFLVEEGVDWCREDVDTTLHDSPLCKKVCSWAKYLFCCCWWWCANYWWLCTCKIHFPRNISTASCIAHIDCPYRACVTFCRFTKSKHLPRHIGQHCPGGGGSGFGQEGRAHSTSLQSRVGRTVGSGGFLGGGLGPVCIIMVRLLSEFEYVHATYLPTWTCWAA